MTGRSACRSSLRRAVTMKSSAYRTKPPIPAVSFCKPSNAIFAMTGLTTPPCGTPAVVSRKTSASTEPALSHCFTNSLAGKNSSLERRKLWQIVSNALLTSASRTQRSLPCLFRQRQHCSMASWQLRPGRNPYCETQTESHSMAPEHFSRLFVRYGSELLEYPTVVAYRQPLGYTRAWQVLPSRFVFFQFTGQFHASFGRQHQLFVNSWCPSTLILLCYSAHRQKQVRETSQHQLHQATHLLPLSILGYPENTSSQVPNSFPDGLPVDGRPVIEFLGSDVLQDSIFCQG